MRTPWTSWTKHATSPSSTQPSTNMRYDGTTADECGAGPSTSGTWCSASSKATRTATSSLYHGRDHTSSRRCSNQAPTSPGPSMAKSSSTPGTSNSYVAFTLKSSCLHQNLEEESQGLESSQDHVIRGSNAYRSKLANSDAKTRIDFL